jgi:putative ABC transport system permease protein
MVFRYLVQSALRSLHVNKLRSFLAMLGIIIGVASMIAMMALVRGAEREIMSQIATLGTNVLLLRPGIFGAGGVISGSQRNLTVDDLHGVIDVPGVLEAAPLVRGSALIKNGNRNSRSLVVGTELSYFSVRAFVIERGELFSTADTGSLSRVVVLGAGTARTLFGESDPVGATVKINDINFRVVGVLKSKGDQGWMNTDDQVVVPLGNAMKQIFGLASLDEIHIRVAEAAELALIKAAITERVRRRHRLQPEEADDFYIRDLSEVRMMASRINDTLKTLLGAVTLLALVIGGIGIMNIMLVTVSERTREIGLRKASGARDRDILVQFLAEAIVMSLAGGLIGVLIGVGSAHLFSRFTNFSTYVAPGSIALALLSSGTVGIYFGYFPARNAARLDPVRALNTE